MVVGKQRKRRDKTAGTIGCHACKPAAAHPAGLEDVLNAAALVIGSLLWALVGSRPSLKPARCIIIVTGGAPALDH